MEEKERTSNEQILLPRDIYHGKGCLEELKNLTGLDEPVRSYVMKWEQTQGFLQSFLSLIDYMLLVPLEGKPALCGNRVYRREAQICGPGPASL